MLSRATSRCSRGICFGQLAVAPVVKPSKAPAVSFEDPGALFEPPPEQIVLPQPGQPWLSRKPRRIDLAEQDVANRGLGHPGERLVGGRSRADGDIWIGPG
jgi:hypothetical protein